MWANTNYIFWTLEFLGRQVIYIKFPIEAEHDSKNFSLPCLSFCAAIFQPYKLLHSWKYVAVQISPVLTYLYLSPGRVKLFEMHTLVTKYEQSKVISLFTVKMHLWKHNKIRCIYSENVRNTRSRSWVACYCVQTGKTKGYIHVYAGVMISETRKLWYGYLRVVYRIGFTHLPNSYM